MARRFFAISALVAFALIISDAVARPARHQRADPDVVSEVETEVQPAEKTSPEEAAPLPVADSEASDLEPDDSEGGIFKGWAKVLTLDDCIKMALERNRKLTAAGYDIEAAEAQLTEAKAAFWPVIEYKTRTAPVPKDVDDAFNKFFEGEVTLFNSIHVGVGMPVLTFGQLHTAKRLAEGGVEAARVKRIKERHETIHQVKTLYYGIQLAQETIKLLEDAVNKLTKKVEEEESREEKEMDPYDLLRLKIFKTELERHLTEAGQNLELAYDGMRIQLDLEPNVEIRLDSDQLRPVIEVLGDEELFADTAMKTLPDLKLLDIGVETRRRQYRLEKLKLLPKAGLGFFIDFGRSAGSITGLQLTDDFNNPFNYTRAGVGLQISGTLDFRGSYARVKKARAEYYKATHERLIARRGLGLDVKKAYLHAKKMRGEVVRAKKAQSMARQMMFLSKVNLDMGIGDEEKYADALKLVLLTRGQYFKAVFDYNSSYGELEKRVGIAEFSNLVKTPDVEEYDAFEDVDEGESETFEEDAVDMEGIENEDDL